MEDSIGRSSRFALALAAALLWVAWGAAPAQVTPAAGSTPPDDTPSVKVGGTIFADYTYVRQPAGEAAKFNIARAYVNVTGNISHLVSFRITPDVKQETKASGTDLNGNYVVRLKFAYGQLNLDDWLPKGSYVRLGMQNTPWIDYMDTIYRYRFQGAAFTDREKLLSSADTGLTARIAFPHSYGDVHFGYYNGEGYDKVELYKQKSFQVRASVRPTPDVPVWKGLRAAYFVDRDRPVPGGRRDRQAAALTFEHDWVNVGGEYVTAKEKANSDATEYEPKGWSFWATPKLPRGFELLFRHDDMKRPENGTDARNKRDIVGAAYWLPVTGKVSTAVLLDYETVKYQDYTTPKMTDKKYFLHCLINF